MSGTRVHHLDWLKVLVVYGIVVYHVSLVFAYGTWLVSNADRSAVLSAFAAFCFPWGIPAMFLIAGADAWFGLRSHGLGEFVWKRFLRLIVPFAAGLVVLSPFQRFITSRLPPPPLDQLPAYYVTFFQSLHWEWSLQIVGKYWLHLWFLGYLFVISVACAPLVMRLHGPRAQRLTDGLVGIGRRAGLFVFALPLLLTQLALRPTFPAYQDWADVATYTIVFLWGAVIFSNRRFEELIKHEIGTVLAVGVASTLALGVSTYVAAQTLWWIPLAQAAAWSVYVWAWLHAVLYLGMRWFDFDGPVVRYAQESVLPVYVIHHPIVLIVAGFVVTLGLGVWAKFGIIVAVVFVLTLTIYEFGIRRWRITRALFGLDPGAVPRHGTHGPSARAVRPLA